MDSQNVERRDSKKSNGKGGGGNNKGQGRGGGNSSSGNNTNNGGKTGPGEKQRSHSQGKSKSYREREIYKPPSLRSSKNRNSNSSSEQQNSRGNIDDALGSANQPQPKRSNSVTSTQQKNAGTTNNNGSSQNGNYNDGNDSSMMPNNGYSLFGNGTGNSGSSSVPSNRMQNNFNGAAAAAFGLANRMYNVNAKEFQLMSQNALHQHQQQQQQISNFLSQFDPAVFYNNSPILASSGCYPLKQSKSSGNMNLLLQQQQQQQQQQAAAFQQLQSAMGFNFPLQPGSYPTGGGGNGNGATNGNSQFNRLSQSKSSGNVPGSGKPRVRFDDEEPDIDDDDLGQQLGNYFASLKLNGDLAGPPQASNFPKSYNTFQQQPQQQQKVPLSPQPVLKSALQKSRTGFYLNLYGNQQQQPPPPTTSAIPGSPTKSAYGLNSAAALAQQTQQRTQSYNVSKLGTSGATPSPNYPSVVKRSRSFGPGTHHLPRTSATTLLCATTAPSSAPHSVYSDFCITKWPKVVQELVTAAVTGVERIPARNWIEMVNRIFEAMLCDFKPSKKENDNQLTGISSSSQSAGSTSGEGQSTSLEASGDALTASAGSAKDVNDVRGGGSSNGTPENEIDYDEDDDEDDLATAAVHIFLYFIQREKDRTVMESLLNTCFASFQRLASSSINSNANSSNPAVKSKSQQQWSMVAGKPPISRQWSNFLRFLSTLYAQVKLIRRQKQSQQQTGHSMDEMSFSLLALLCDSCLATLRSPQSYTAEMMGCLFTVLTSIGRDMEGTFPLKMKQLLAAVRDALLGIGPYHQQQQHHHNNNNSNSSAATSKFSGVSPIVQKTLMQLIELHACNWQLPASAVRYYYSSVSKSSTSSTNTNNNAGSLPSSHVGSSQTQQINSSNSNAHLHLSTTVASTSSSPATSTAVSNDNNDDGAGAITVNSVNVNNSSDTEKESASSTASTASTLSSVTQPTPTSVITLAKD